MILLLSIAITAEAQPIFISCFFVAGHLKFVYNTAVGMEANQSVNILFLFLSVNMMCGPPVACASAYFPNETNAHKKHLKKRFGDHAVFLGNYRVWPLRGPSRLLISHARTTIANPLKKVWPECGPFVSRNFTFL